MAKIWVDGVEYEVDEKKNLIDALKEKGVEIPHFCYHPKLSVVGMCRICLIEIEGVPKFQAACNTPIKDGMKINAFGEKIVKAREGVMEFLLINHPLDCPVCDKAGECRLQDYSFKLGHETTRYKEEKRNIPQEKIGTNLYINHNRCILCYRCVRFDREIVGVNDLEMLSRGNDTIIAYVPPETEKEKSPYLNHNYQGALADICPVGALLNESTLFRSRVWWYESKESHCHGCATLCRVTANLKNNAIYRYMPPQHPERDGYFICDYGRFSTHDFSQNRLYAYRRSGTKIRSQEALAQLAELLAQAKRIAVLGGGSESCTDVDALAELVGKLRDAGKTVQWDFRSNAQAFYSGNAQWDFLLSKDLRPNAAYLRQKNATDFADFTALEKELGQAELILVVGELSPPYAYQTGKIYAHVKGLKIPTSVEQTELYQALDTHNAWPKTVLLTTHADSAADKALLAIPIQSFVEKSGRFCDKEGNFKETTVLLRPVQGLRSSGEIWQSIPALEPVGVA
ncbi:MAG: 2Fe-2S iron-sulfur cluster-binding protein [Leptospiraceae bacterium]|nr:2Fe-2S iron-sulfur cluster-binding protein [Leptospiraceae bacterium]